jgi:poly [ADP-ribose] polymerase
MEHTSEHIIEAAKSGRAACRKCRKKIGKGELRLGVETEGDYGVSYQWYHLECGGQARAAELEQALASYDGEVPDRDKLDALIAENKGKKSRGGKKTFPYAEPAPSGRSTCLQCEDKIPKGELRVAVEMEIDTGSFTTMGARYLHARCAAAFTGSDAGELYSMLEANSELEAEGLESLKAALA